MKIKGTFLQTKNEGKTRVLIIKKRAYCSILKTKTLRGISIFNNKIDDDFEMTLERFKSGVRSGEIRIV